MSNVCKLDIYYFRAFINRLMFNPTRGFQWNQCMDTCPKYRRSQPSSFDTIEQMEEFFDWSTITTKDPKTFEYYSDVDSEAFWMPFRYVGCKSRPWDFSN